MCPCLLSLLVRRLVTITEICEGISVGQVFTGAPRQGPGSGVSICSILLNALTSDSFLCFPDAHP